MSDWELLGPWLRRFLVEHLVTERNLARSTQQSHRDTLVLLVDFAAHRVGQPAERLAVMDVGADLVREFLCHLARDRHCSPQTCNQRLCALRAFARFVASPSPEHLGWTGQVRSLPLQRCSPPPVTQLEKSEVDAQLAVPDRTTSSGRRDHAVLLPPTTRAREFRTRPGSECGTCTWLGKARKGATALAVFHGKAGKTRNVPLWRQTSDSLAEMVAGRPAEASVFLSRHGRPYTRFGVLSLVRRCARKAARPEPSVATKRVSPHVLRHPTATHLPRMGVDLNTIRAWLGHAGLDTTNIYAEVDLATKAKALACCASAEGGPTAPWKEAPGLLAFLKAL